MQVTCSPLQDQFLEISTQSTLPNVTFTAVGSLPAPPNLPPCCAVGTQKAGVVFLDDVEKALGSQQQNSSGVGVFLCMSMQHVLL